VVFTNTTDSIGDTTRDVSLVLTIKPYSINFLPVKLRTNEFYLWFCDLIDYTIKALKATDDPLLEVPNEFIDLIGGTTDESNKKAIQAYYNTMVRPSIGTQWLMDVLTSMFETPYTIQEWYEYSGDSFKFRIKGDETAVDFSATEKEKLIALINEFKNERSRLEGFIFEISFTDNITDITMSDLSLGGNKLEYYQRDGSITRDGTKIRGAHTTTPFS
jgi:hypothetical protein